MKSLVIVLVFISIVQDCNAQFFAQKKTRRELLLQQIAALQVYTGYLKKGYEVVTNGINTISDIKNGDFDLHSIFFDSYKEVNPIILNYEKVPAIMHFAEVIESSCSNSITMIDKDANLTQEEKNYLQDVINTLLNKTNVTLDQLMMVTTNELLEMKDDERIEWIDRIYKDIKDKYVFVQSFSKSIWVLSAQRLHTQTEINTSKALNGLK